MTYTHETVNKVCVLFSRLAHYRYVVYVALIGTCAVAMATLAPQPNSRWLSIVQRYLLYQQSSLILRLDYALDQRYIVAKSTLNLVIPSEVKTGLIRNRHTLMGHSLRLLSADILLFDFGLNLSGVISKVRVGVSRVVEVRPAWALFGVGEDVRLGDHVYHVEL